MVSVNSPRSVPNSGVAITCFRWLKDTPSHLSTATRNDYAEVWVRIVILAAVFTVLITKMINRFVNQFGLCVIEMKHFLS